MKHLLAGACLLVEDTREHRRLFGDEGECVVYFDSAPRLIAQARRLVAAPALRAQLAAAAHQRIVVEGRNTYADRLARMLELEQVIGPATVPQKGTP